MLSLLIDLQHDVNCALLVDGTDRSVGLARRILALFVEDTDMLGNLVTKNPVITRKLKRQADGIVGNLLFFAKLKPVSTIFICFDKSSNCLSSFWN